MQPVIPCNTYVPLNIHPVVDKSHTHSATTGMLNIPTLNTLSPVTHPLCSPQFIVELWSLMFLHISYILLPVTWPSLVCSSVHIHVFPCYAIVGLLCINLWIFEHLKLWYLPGMFGQIYASSTTYTWHSTAEKKLQWGAWIAEQHAQLNPLNQVDS